MLVYVLLKMLEMKVELDIKISRDALYAEEQRKREL